MRRRGKVDRNQPEIVRALRQAGASVLSMSDLGDGAPDIAVGLRGQTFFFEIKDGLAKPSERRLTEQEKLWHQNWRGHVEVVESVKDALRAVGLL